MQFFKLFIVEIKKWKFLISSFFIYVKSKLIKVRDDYGEWSSEVTIIVTITSNPSNNPPIADAGGPYTGYVNQNLTFDGSASSDPNAGDSITSYQWNFGDDNTGEGVTIGHTYTSEGNYTVELTVTDGNGEQTKIATYANIELEDSQNGTNGDEDNGVPGFEAVFVIIAIAFFIKSSIIL